jgi:hypothetical protein
MKKAWEITWRLALVAFAIVIISAAAVGCGSTPAQVASHNLSKEAELFQIQRRIVFYNAITDKIMLNVEGACSIETPEAEKIEVTCRAPNQKLFKDYLGLSDNVTYIVQQLEPVSVSTSHYKVVFQPSALIPEFSIP